MINQRELTNELERMENLRTLIEAYEEIAANRMRKNRSIVLAARLFNEGLSKMYQEIKGSYKNQLESLMHRRHIKDKKGFTLIKRNGKTAAVLLSSNAGLYGDIVNRIANEFVEYVEKNQCDMAVIGRLGKKIIQERLPDRQVTYFDLPDTNVSQDSIEQLAQYLIQYEQIYVFFGRFESVGVQRPSILDMSGSDLTQEGNSAAQDKTKKIQDSSGNIDTDSNVKYLFEPDLESIMVFFEKQIFASIIEQSLKESELAKFASRMITLDSANESVKSAQRSLTLQKRILLHRQVNKKQQDLYSGIMLWKK